jgi:hypothetical protein
MPRAIVDARDPDITLIPLAWSAANGGQRDRS